MEGEMKREGGEGRVWQEGRKIGGGRGRAG